MSDRRIKPEEEKKREKKEKKRKKNPKNKPKYRIFKVQWNTVEIFYAIPPFLFIFLSFHTQSFFSSIFRVPTS